MSIEKIKISDRDTWLQQRRKDVTASDVAALFGCSPFKTRLELYNEKAGANLVPADHDNEAMRRGRWLESAAGAAIREEKPNFCLQKTAFYLRDRQARLGATPDFMTKDGILVEVKAPIQRTFAADWREAPPVYYQLQALTQARLLGAEKAIIAVFMVTGFDVELRLYEIPRHEGAENKIIKAVNGFWQSIAEKKPPLPDYNHDLAVLKEIYAHENRPEIDLSSDENIRTLCEEGLRWSTRKTECEKALNFVTAEILDALKGSEGAFHPEFKITNKSQKRKETILPEREFRVLRVSRKKEDEDE